MTALRKSLEYISDPLEHKRVRDAAWTLFTFEHLSGDHTARDRYHQTIARIERIERKGRAND